MDKMRLQVFLSRSGYCSRREAMKVIQQGRVSVNGKVINEPSFGVNGRQDDICVDDKLIQAQSQKYYIILHKPSGYVTTKADWFAKKKVVDLLPHEFKHLNPVGRLDKETEGLLLMTNDGDLLYALTHPKFEVGKTYEVRVKGELTDNDIQALQGGIKLDGKLTSPAQVSDVNFDGKATRFFMTIHEGWNRQIRRMCEAVGHPVRYLKRVQHGPLELGDLSKGSWRHLESFEVKVLKEKVGA